MKTINILSASLLLMALGKSAAVNAQKKDLVTPFRKGTVTANFGIGFGGNYRNEFRSSSLFGTKAAIEFGIWQAGPGIISIGAETGASISGKSDNPKYNDFRSRTIIISGRSAWHYGWKVSRLDTYAGLSGGAGFHHYDFNNGNRQSIDEVIPVFGVFAGASYFFSNSFGVNVEAGYDITALQAGVIFKLR